MIVLENLPVPPSSNSQYISFMGAGGRVVHKPAPDLKAFKKAMQDWAMHNYAVVSSASQQIKAWMAQDARLEVCLYLTMTHEKLYTKEGSVRKWDISNRIKAIHDEVANLLGVDDSQFFAVRAEKLEGKDPGVTLTIERYLVKTKASNH